MCDHCEKKVEQETATKKTSQSSNLSNVLLVVVLVLVVVSAFMQGYIFGVQHELERQETSGYIYEYYEPTPPLMENV